MATGVYEATKKDGTLYYRSNIHYKGKHIALGSYKTYDEANHIFECAKTLLSDEKCSLQDAFTKYGSLPYEKTVILINYRDHGMYLGTPIYLMQTYFLYYLSPDIELKFDNDDLFYYSSHKILRRGGHLYINDYGMQVNLLSRYGIKNHAVAGIDYEFVNGDNSDFRYANIKNINPYYGVSKQDTAGRISYLVRIHINGNYQVGIYTSETEAAIAYNKAVDLAKAAGISKAYPTNYISGLSAREYADIYTKIGISKAYRDYLEQLNC